jgi:hypothetical protein
LLLFLNFRISPPFPQVKVIDQVQKLYLHEPEPLEIR